MKRLISFVLTVLMIAGAVSACQRKPEGPLAASNSFVRLEKRAEGSVNAPSSQTLRDKLRIPEKLQTQFVSKGGKLRIDADAVITVPDTAQIPIVEVGHGHFDAEDAKRYAKVLFQDAIPLDPDNTKTTKASWQKSLDSLLALKERGELDKYETMKELDAAIAEVRKEIENAPETYTPSAHDFDWKDPQRPLDLRAARDNATVSDLRVQRECIEYYGNLDRNAPLSAVRVGTGGPYIESKLDLTRETGYTPDQADKLAVDTLRALEIKDMVCTGRRGYTFTQDGFSVYEFVFTREVQGIPVTFTNDRGFDWAYEKVRVFIDETGILHLVHEAPLELKRIVSKDTAMLSFAEIQSIFERMAPIVNDLYDKYGMDCDMRIHEVRLGLMRITERNPNNPDPRNTPVPTEGMSAPNIERITPDTGWIVPVWDFMATSTTWREGDPKKSINNDAYNSVLTINAIDGSIVDRELGE